MASTVFPAAAAASSKTMFRTMLTSGTSYTVPTGALYLNITTIGGGAGGVSGNPGNYNGIDGTGGQMCYSTLSSTPGNSIAYTIGAGGATASDGGSTTFTGATTALGGNLSSASVAAAGRLNGASNYGRGGINSYSATGGAGAAGSIIVEYWV